MSPDSALSPPPADARAGYGDGFEMEILVLMGSDFHIRSAQAIQEQLEPLGITVTVSRFHMPLA